MELFAAANRVTQRVMTEALTDRNYGVDLALEALLELHAVTGNDSYRQHVLDIVNRRSMHCEIPVPFEKEPFASLTYALWRCTGDDAWLRGFLQESERCRREMPVSPDGLALHPRGEQRGGGLATVIDAMQEFVCRLVRAGVASGDDSSIQTAMAQWRDSRAVLRDPQTGLWSQGRGWLTETPDALSPGAWSRGHGWLFRGLTASLRVLPPKSQAAAEFRHYLTELADAVLPLQAQDGMWHAILSRPATDSPPDTSGSAMIATGLAESVRCGWLTGERYASAARRTFAVLPGYVTADGIVLSTSPGPGPLQSEEDYLVPAFPPGNDHGTFALLFAGVEDCRAHP
ncbi:MAG: glycoside hydrolase family 88 protein [Armatimonadota bacterium]